MSSEEHSIQKKLISKNIHCFIQLVAFGLMYDEAYERSYGKDAMAMEKGRMLAEEYKEYIDERSDQILDEEGCILPGLRFPRRVAMFESLDLGNSPETRLKAINAYLKVYDLNAKINPQDKAKDVVFGDIKPVKLPEEMTPEEREKEILNILNKNIEGK